MRTRNPEEEKEYWNMNKKEYVKAEAQVIVLPMNENIAASAGPIYPDKPDVFIGDDDVFDDD
jgi:hypothetical protein